MSTNSAVILKVRKCDIGKMVKFNEEKLPIRLDKWEYKDNDGKVWRKETGENICRRLKLTKPYIAIYCHWDGDYVGKALRKSFKDYNSILNLIAGGFCSYIESNEVRHYGNREDEKWDWIKPIQKDSVEEILKAISSAEYAYLFDENEWKDYEF